MNCLEFRRQVGAEPSSTLPAVLAHREACAVCAGYQDEMRSLDRLLGRAMRVDVVPRSAWEVPGTLETGVSGTREAALPTTTTLDRVPDTSSGREPGTTPVAGPDPSRARHATTPPRRWLAMAASVVAGVLVAATLWLSYPEPSLAAEVIGHVVSEPDAQQADQPLAAQAITAVLEPSHVRLRPGMGTVTFAMRCVFEGHVVPHLVVQTDEGPVTVLLLAHRQVQAATRIETDGYAAVVLPAPRGSIAIVGRNVSGIDAIAQRVFDSVDWNA
jgi:hypothetical protein